MAMAASRRRAVPASLVTAAATVVLVLLSAPAVADVAARYPPLAPGLSFEFYKESCPMAECIVKDYLETAIMQNVGLAAALIRLHFHDCFVQGCDGSILLDSTPTEESEQAAIPNLTLRPAAFKAINDIRDRLEQACGRVVSCADIVALSARESVGLAGGPGYKVPLGRRDSLKPASQQAVNDGLPPPTSDVTNLLGFLAKINLDVNDLVAISGGHTVGIAHCGSFDERLFPTQDPTMNKWFAGHLKLTCPVKGTDNTTVNDIRTPNTFDNKYYVDLLNREGLFTSDQDLFTDGRTKPMVTKFAVDQNAFFEQFIFSYVKMGQIQVLTGSQGQIRANCSARNPGDNLPWSIVETAVDAAESLVL
ncbi:cationic peroxidase SPC4-like [Phragmites australis]|uniref:cationic peroxidase SPC4-like n=1 Tax=Phragmites australis TaxID=29695 RepID=UPI002D78312B|nr:cationic peroxidase SPC4-like [Phragmites australis]